MHRREFKSNLQGYMNSNCGWKILSSIKSILIDFPGGLGSKESAWNTEDPGLIPGSRRSPGEGNGNPFQYSCLENSMHRGAWWATVHGGHRVGHDWASNRYWGFLGGAALKNPPAHAGDIRHTGSISGSGRSPGEGNGYPLQYSSLENSMNRGGWWAMVHGFTKSRTLLSD